MSEFNKGDIVSQCWVELDTWKEIYCDWSKEKLDDDVIRGIELSVESFFNNPSRYSSWMKSHPLFISSHFSSDSFKGKIDNRVLKFFKDADSLKSFLIKAIKGWYYNKAYNNSYSGMWHNELLGNLGHIVVGTSVDRNRKLTFSFYLISRKWEEWYKGILANISLTSEGILSYLGIEHDTQDVRGSCKSSLENLDKERLKELYIYLHKFRDLRDDNFSVFIWDCNWEENPENRLFFDPRDDQLWINYKGEIIYVNQNWELYVNEFWGEKEWYQKVPASEEQKRNFQEAIWNISYLYRPEKSYDTWYSQTYEKRDFSF